LKTTKTRREAAEIFLETTRPRTENPAKNSLWGVNVISPVVPRRGGRAGGRIRASVTHSSRDEHGTLVAQFVSQAHGSISDGCTYR